MLCIWTRSILEDWKRRGGFGKVVEVCKKIITAEKKRGTVVLGGVEQGSDKVFMQIVPLRYAVMLLPVIITSVKPGTDGILRS